MTSLPSKCPVCKTGCKASRKSLDYSIICPRCGQYEIAKEAYDDFSSYILSNTQLAQLSGKLIHGLYNGQMLNGELIQKIQEMPPLSVGEKAEQFISYWSKKYPKPGIAFPFKVKEQPAAISSAYAEDDTELEYIIRDFLEKSQGWVEIISPSNDKCKIKPKGWEHISHIKTTPNKDNKNVFCAMWFSDETQPFFNTIKAVIETLGYNCIRIDLVEHNNKICDEIIKHIKSSRFVIADFTGHRGGVYYEVGLAHGRNIPAIFTCRDDHFSGLHFDIRQYNCIRWFNNKLDVLESELKNRIIAQIS